MLNLLKTILIKLIPDNWYTTKKTCDVIVKICDTVIELRWFVFPTITVVTIILGIGFIYFCKWNIVKIKHNI
jgi:hypothetical protein